MQEYTGTLAAFEYLSEQRPDLRIASVFVSQVHSNLPPVLFAVQRLHLIALVHNLLQLPPGFDPVRASTQHIILDSNVNSWFDTSPFFSSAAELLRIPMLERLLLRCTELDDEERDVFCERAMEWTTDLRDERVWLDSTPSDDVSCCKLDLASAHRGRKLWLSGRQLYSQASPEHVASVGEQVPTDQ